MLLDPETLALAPGVERLLPAEGLKTELFSCLVETNTPVCETAAEALDELAPAPPASSPSARGARGSPSPRPDRIRSRSRRSSRSSTEPRYLKMVEELGAIAQGPARVRPPRPRRDGELRCVPAHARRDPALAAATCSRSRRTRRTSPGEETGALSSRARHGCGELPRGGPPPRSRRWRTGRPTVAAAGVDYTRIWWDARPHPRLGTLEVRIADQATSVDALPRPRSSALGAGSSARRRRSREAGR